MTKAFPPDLVDRVVATTDTREIRRRLLPARLVVYFVLALWLFRGPNCGYGRVMVKLVDALYHRRRGQQLLAGVLDPDGWVDAGEGRRWRPPNISSLSRARTRLGADPLHMLFDEVAGPVGALDAAGVCCGGLRVVSMDGSTTDVPDTKANDEYFGRPSNATRAGAFPQVRWIVAAESGTGALLGASFGPYTVGEQTLARDLLGAFGPGMLVLADRNLCATRRFITFPAQPGGIGGEFLDLMAYSGSKETPGTRACQKTGGRVQADGATRREVRTIRLKLDCLNPNLQWCQGPARRKVACNRRRPRAPE